MNSREKLFFKNITLHKSMSYTKREDEERVNKLKENFRLQQQNRLLKKEQFKKKNNNIYKRLITWLFKK